MGGTRFNPFFVRAHLRSSFVSIRLLANFGWVSIPSSSGLTFDRGSGKAASSSSFRFNPFFVRAHLRSSSSFCVSAVLRRFQSLLRQGSPSIAWCRNRLPLILLCFNPFFVRAHLRSVKKKSWRGTKRSCFNPFFVRAHLRSLLRRHREAIAKLVSIPSSSGLTFDHNGFGERQHSPKFQSLLRQGSPSIFPNAHFLAVSMVTFQSLLRQGSPSIAV